MDRQKGMHSSRTRRHSIRKFQDVKVCPVTNGLPTTMTLEGFKAACEQCREQEKPSSWDRKYYKNGWCDVCQGEKLPKELRVVSLEKLKKQRMINQYMKSRGMREHSPAR